MIHELNHLGIVAQDIRASERFFVDLLGARVAWQVQLEEVGLEILYLQLADGLVELIGVPDPHAAFGANHLGFLSDDLEGDYAALVASGADGLVAPKDTATGAGRQAIVGDPDGIRIELLQRDLPLRQEQRAHPHIRSIDHFAVQADEHDRSLAFYRDGLGMSVAKQIPIPQLETTLTYLRHGDDVVELLPRVHEGPRLHHIALQVDDAHAMDAHLVALGATTNGVSPAAGGVGSVGSTTAPDGVVIEYVDRPGVLEA